MDAQPGAGNAIRDQLANFLSLVTTQVDSLEAQNRALLAERDRLGRELTLKQEEAQAAMRKASDAQAILDSAIAESDKRREQGARYAELIRAQAQQAALSLRELAERIEADAQQRALEFEAVAGGPLPTGVAAVLAPDNLETLPVVVPKAVSDEKQSFSEAPVADLSEPEIVDDESAGYAEELIAEPVVDELVASTARAEAALAVEDDAPVVDAEARVVHAHAPVIEAEAAPALEDESPVVHLEKEDEETAVAEAEPLAGDVPVAIAEPVAEDEVVEDGAPVSESDVIATTEDGDLLTVAESDRVTSEIEAIADEPQTLAEAADAEPVSYGAEDLDEAPAIGQDREPEATLESDAVVDASAETPPVEAAVETPAETRPFVPPILESNIAPPRPGVTFPALSPTYVPRYESPVPPIVPPVVPAWKPEVVGREEEAPVEELEPVAEVVEDTADDHRSGWQGAVINRGWTNTEEVVEEDEPQAPFAEVVAAAVPESNESVTYDVIARPFTNFSSLVTFQKAIREIPGVSDVRVRVFQNNALSMSLTYGGSSGVTSALNLVNGFDVTDISIDDNRIEMTVVSTASKASA